LSIVDVSSIRILIWSANIHPVKQTNNKHTKTIIMPKTRHTNVLNVSQEPLLFVLKQFASSIMARVEA
jgi:hypothetical protein